MANQSIVHGRRSGRGIKPVAMTGAQVGSYEALRRVGIHFSPAFMNQAAQLHGFGMDANDVGVMPAPLAGITTASVGVPLQFLQAWLPGFVEVASAARVIDELIGINTVGSWEDEEVVQGVLEPLGQAVPYFDNTNIPLASWNTNFERRTVVRFEQGFQIGTLEEARAARMRVSTSAAKRGAAATALDIQRNRVGFYGFNAGNNRTYGLLNDPSLPAYVAVPNGAGGSPLWQNKTMLEMIKDIRLGLSQLRINSKGVVDPKKSQITLALGTSRIDMLTTTSDFGYSVLDWLQRNYPNVRVESAPEFDDANGGAAVFYLYADKIADTGDDGGEVIMQVVPSRFMTLGVEKRAKGYVEDFSNATAGVMVKRPYAVYRATGI